ncbi:hypothetical protein [Burkholderia guangdongensis]|uniref:COG4648 family protein n=1 Tax=Burkholderia guangdongensis TaxID=1792500 RepID=UPI0015CE00D1|nr:hypothetical protein [Burkholderia guangdongensis]
MRHAREYAVDSTWRRRMRVAARVALMLAYPFVFLLAWRGIAPRYVGCMLILLLWLQRWIGTGSFASALNRLTRVDWCVALVLSAISLTIAVTDSEMLLRLYPAFVSAGLLAAFGVTLYRGPSMIEKFARTRARDPSTAVVRYTRRVTQIWCAFFVLNGAFSVYTAMCWSRAAWSLYNGAIVYALIGALLVGEWIWRQWFVMPRHGGAGAA